MSWGKPCTTRQPEIELAYREVRVCSSVHKAEIDRNPSADVASSPVGMTASTHCNVPITGGTGLSECLHSLGNLGGASWLDDAPWLKLLDVPCIV